MFTRAAPGGLSELINAIIRNAQATPDYLSDDAWQALVNLEQMIERIGWMKNADAGRLLDQVDLILMQLATFSGLSNDTMSRTFAYRFMDIGRRLERASKTSMLNYAFRTLKPQDINQWELVLEVTDTVMTYRRRYRTRLNQLLYWIFCCSISRHLVRLVIWRHVLKIWFKGCPYSN